MKLPTLEEQVCSLDLAKRLKELDAPQDSYLSWYDLSGKRYGTPYIRFELRETGKPILHPLICAAYTVAELGAMLPDEEVSYDSALQYRPFRQHYPHTGKVEWKFDNPYTVYSRETHVLSVTTEADARAKMLIHLLEKKLITL